MQLPTFYSPAMVASTRSYSPSAHKPAELIAFLQARAVPLAVHVPLPVDEAELARAHDLAYVRDVLACRRPNGFGDRSREVAASLRWTSGAMVSAARHAVATRSVAFAPCSGFHHAGWAHGGGFCTFNGLMVAATSLHLEDHIGRIGILDCDMHYGDGTDDILEHLAPLDARAFVRHFTAGRTYGSPAQAEAFLAALPGIVREMADCGVILYQAGADPHIDDPLGGWLDDEQLRRRDEIVFTHARAMGVPIAWNLAGGYRRDADGGIEPVLRTHEATVRVCLEVYGPSAVGR